MQAKQEYYLTLSTDVLRDALRGAGIELPRTKVTAFRLISIPADGRFALETNEAPLGTQHLTAWSRVYEKTNGDDIDRRGPETIQPGQYL